MLCRIGEPRWNGCGRHLILCARCGRTAQLTEQLIANGCAPKDLVPIDDKDIKRDAEGRVIDCHAAAYRKRT